jgi:type I restriction enzyme S subunit
LILELAVQGKLVPQDPNDEPASVLLERITVEKMQLIKENKIKKQKTLPKIPGEEKPFELPDGWDWVRLCDIGVIASSSRVHKKDWQTEGIPFYRAREIVKLSRFGTVDNELYISESLFGDLSEKGFVPELNDLMITGVGTIGVPYVVQKTDKFYFKDASVLIFKNLHGLFSGYLFQFMKSPYWYRSVHEGSMGTTVHTLTITRANEVLVPVPPEKEQHRIVTKVDELMALCDQLEQQTESSLNAHKLLVDTLLASLLKPTEGSLTDTHVANDLSDNWARLADHFDTLITTDYAVEQLKQTILQLAVMGKLVPQDPSDEPASELLKRIAAEKEQLIKDKKIKKQKALPVVGEDEKSFEIPEGWGWVRLQDVTNLITDGKHGDCTNLAGSGYYFLSAKNIQNQQLVYEHARQIELEEFNEVHQRTNLEPYDICMVNTGATVGKIAIAEDNELTRKSTFQKSVAVIKPTKPFLSSYYLTNYLISETPNLLKKSGGSAINNLLLGDIKSKVFPLPPVEEQSRIVKKVDELMALCDQLKAQLNDAKSTQLQLADVVVGEALN